MGYLSPAESGIAFGEHADRHNKKIEETGDKLNSKLSDTDEKLQRKVIENQDKLESVFKSLSSQLEDKLRRLEDRMDNSAKSNFEQIMSGTEAASGKLQSFEDKIQVSQIGVKLAS